MVRMTRFGTRWMLAVLVTLVMGACAQAQRNPFSEDTGIVTIRIQNRSDEGLNISVLGGEQPVLLGNFVAGESREAQIRWEGEKDLRLRLSRVIGGETADTFPVSARPGDTFILRVEQGRALQSVRLVRAF